MVLMEDKLKIGGRLFNSRLIIGSGKFSSNEVMKQAVESSHSDILTVALRRVDIKNPNDDILKHVPANVLLLPNTSGARDAEEAVRIAKIARAALDNPWVKLEVTPNPYNLLPCPIETFKAAEILVKDGFNVMPYINADAILAKKLEEIGCVSVMPLAAPIGTNKGLTTKEAIIEIINSVSVPVVVDAGLGAPSHAAEAIELGADAVLVNTAIATAKDPVKMALAFKLAVEAAFIARCAGLASKKTTANASSPEFNFLRDLE